MVEPMSKPGQSDERLEHLLGQGLRDLPLRKAPASLETRVFGELARRESLAWWQRSFAHWPVAPRAAFISVCVALIVLTLLGGLSAFVGVSSFDEFEGLLLSLLHPVLVASASAGGLAALLVRVIPPLWLYGGMAVGAMLYVMLFGLGAAAYRTLYLRPSKAGESL
jgi:hypothetical protein